MTTRSLFILKRRADYGTDPSYESSYQIATGMYNSAKFVVDELEAAGREAKLVIVIDGNDIDREVTEYKPTHVFIEGLWVTPLKFRQLKSIARHKDVKWHVRIHSEIPFVATEGTAFDWIPQYLDERVYVAPNAPRAHEQVKWLATNMIGDANATTYVPLLPNCYPVDDFQPIGNLSTRDKDTLDIACFGAHRPMKNHLQSAFIALRYAESQGKKLRFHVNNRTDQGGDSPAKNVRNLLSVVNNAELVEHSWEDRETFLQSLSEIDLLLQVSMSETFNIVAADATLVGRPMLVSKEISWAYPTYGDPQSVDDCLKKLELIMSNKKFFINSNRAGLNIYAASARRRWLNYLGV
jgi:hypothetical protein